MSQRVTGLALGGFPQKPVSGMVDQEGVAKSNLHGCAEPSCRTPRLISELLAWR